MKKSVGIRHEDKYAMERRSAITPELTEKLLREKPQLAFKVEKSEKRVFNASAYESAGAEVVNSVRDCDVIFGVKEIPESYFEKGKTYVFFSHVIKGQPYNMPMLKKMMELSCNLIDYEKIEDEMGRRLIFFGRYAGLAGMINSLWSLGLRLKELGEPSNPFEAIRQAYTYNSLEEVKEVISEVGYKIAKEGLPKSLCPFVTGFTGYGNVSVGAQEIYNLLPVKEISPDELLTLKEQQDLPNNVLYKVVFKEKDLVRPLHSGTFDLQEYYSKPEKYTNDFEKYVPQLSVLMNCMYWDSNYPRIVTKDFLAKYFENHKSPKLLVIGDITCDPDGSIEATHKGTAIEDPVFVYNPFTRNPSMGFKGKGVLIMAVDILPSELPRESSMAFSKALEKFVIPIALADYDSIYDEIDLPPPVKRALILYKGQLTPPFKYISQYL